MTRIPYQFALVGMSGKGKTMAFRNMDLDKTGFINIESKPLPFLNKFKNYCTPDTWQEAYTKLIEYAKNPEVEVVVLDSFSAYIESLLKTARENKRGFDVWNFYNEEIGKLMFIVRKYPKMIVVTAHYEWVETEEGAIEKRIMVKGKEWKGMVEKEFTITHFVDMKLMDGKREYYIDLHSDGKTSAKTPPMFFDNENRIDNDYSIVINRVKEKFSQSNK